MVVKAIGKTSPEVFPPCLHTLYLDADLLKSCVVLVPWLANTDFQLPPQSLLDYGLETGLA